MIYNYTTKPEGGFRNKVKGEGVSPIDRTGKDKAKATVFYLGIENETEKTAEHPEVDYHGFDSALEASCPEVYAKKDASITPTYGTGLEVISRPCVSACGRRRAEVSVRPLVSVYVRASCVRTGTLVRSYV